jgi:hypothetical protein
MRNIFLVFALLLTISQAGTAQRSADTTAVIREFNDVMAFSVQPYLHYTSVISMRTGPMAPSADTGRILHGSFYKYDNDLYYGSEQEEMYLQDSLMIKVDHRHKTIQVSKVDVATKKNMDLVPLKKMDQQKLLRSHYTISKRPDEGDTASIVIRSQAAMNVGQSRGEEILMEYTKQGHLPLLMQITVRIREQESDQVKNILKSSGFDVQQMKEDMGGQPSLVMTQTASVQFGAMETTREAAMQMPLWKEKLFYDPVSGSYSGKGDYSGYRIIKTF